MEETERLQRELRAMANVNRQLQTEVTEAKNRPAKATRPAPSQPTTTVAKIKARGRAYARKGRTQYRRARAAIERRGPIGAGKEAARRATRKVRKLTKR
jgi:hypothetical protein